jgi:DNA polymerase elongation subunit (family B)
LIFDGSLIYDIETRTFGKPDKNIDRFKLFGCYSYLKNKKYILTNLHDVQKIIDAHKFIIGYNVNEYDNVVLLREGISTKYKKIIDLFDTIKKYSSTIKTKKGILNELLMTYKLSDVINILDLGDNNTGKKEIDYKIFQKDIWTQEETKLVYEYLDRDIDITKKLYEWIENYFKAFTPFLREEDIVKKNYLVISTAKFAYKNICKEMNWEETYGEYGLNEGEDDNISGGYVSFPAGDFYSNKDGYIFYLDYASLYPHINIMCNVFSRQRELDNRPTWNGNNIWKVVGNYYCDKMSPLGELLIKYYNQRLQFKEEGNPQEYGVKIIINTGGYGIIDNPYYVRVYDKVASADITSIGRQWIKYARKRFKENGYINIYGDTDSIFIFDPFKDKEKMLKIKQQIIDEIKQSVPFPQETFNMKIEDEVKYLYFFKGKVDSEINSEMDEDDKINIHKGLMKKNYIYVSTNDKVVIKNLGLRKKSNSELSKKIFWKHLLPKIKEGQIKFPKKEIKNLIYELLNKDIKLAEQRKEVGTIEQYKKSPTSIQAQISSKYGSGIHFLIPNLRNIGVGKGKSMCTIEEFNNNKLTVYDIDLDNVWSELSYFVKEPEKVNIFSFGKSEKNG